jgi:hypothetical protein
MPQKQSGLNFEGATNNVELENVNRECAMPYGVGAVVSWAARECEPQPRGSGRARADYIEYIEASCLSSAV